jgi:hypothetical protein
LIAVGYYLYFLSGKYIIDKFWKKYAKTVPEENNMKRLSIITLLAAMSLAAISPMVWAVKTVYIEQNTEEMFKKGEPNQVIISSTGEISLARQSRQLLGDQDELWVVNAMVKAEDDSLYVATSGKGYIYRLKPPSREPEIIYGNGEDDQEHVFSLALDQKGRLLAGTGGQAGLLLRFDNKDQVETLFRDSDETIKYIWSIVVGPAGRIYLGTGPTGKVLTLDADGGNMEVLYQAKEKNILAVARDADGIIYAGGDENGLVYRIDPGTKKATIAYDTGHSEISGLVFDEEGNLYVATADPSTARPGAKLILSDGDTSRAETDQDKEDEDADDNQEPQDSDEDADDNQESKDSDEDSKASDDSATKLIPAATAKTDKDSTGGPDFVSQVANLAPAEANNVYKIARDGYVTTLFHEKVIILAMAYIGDGQLLLGTGNEGKLIMLHVDTQEAAVLHTFKPSAQVSTLCLCEDGGIYAGGANPGAVIVIDPDYSRQGIYFSEMIDAKQISHWGKLQIEADIPQAATLQVATRSGNTSDPEKGGWQQWSSPTDAAETIAISSPPGRFLQYRLDFANSDGRSSPVVKAVKLAHMIPNLPPQVKKVTAQRTDSDKSDNEQIDPSKNIMIKWETEEPNSDKLIYELFVRQVDCKQWIRIAKELEKQQFKWNTLTVSDGRYEIKVTASDKPDNSAGQELAASRISSVVVVDNTPPQISRMSYDLDGNTLRFHAQIEDDASVIGAVDYVLDSGENWQMALPNDGIFDSRQEQVEFEQEINEPGEHLLAVRFEDDLGNRTYRSLTFVVPDKEK